MHFVPFIVSFARSAHGSRAANIGANSVNKMTQAFVLSPRNERNEKNSRLLLSSCIYFSRDTTIWCLTGPVAWGISLVMDNFLPTGFYDRWKQEKSGFSFVRHASTIDAHGCAIVTLVTRVPLLHEWFMWTHSLRDPPSGALIIFRAYLWQYCAKAGGKKNPPVATYSWEVAPRVMVTVRKVLSTDAACSHVDCFCFTDLA